MNSSRPGTRKSFRELHLDHVHRELDAVASGAWVTALTLDGQLAIRIDSGGDDSLLRVFHEIYLHLKRTSNSLRTLRRTYERSLRPFARLAVMATSGPWLAFVEDDGGMGGESFIRTGGDDGPDIYLRFGTKVAAGRSHRLVAETRQVIPVLFDVVADRAAKNASG